MLYSQKERVQQLQTNQEQPPGGRHICVQIFKNRSEKWSPEKPIKHNVNLKLEFAKNIYGHMRQKSTCRRNKLHV